MLKLDNFNIYIEKKLSSDYTLKTIISKLWKHLSHRRRNQTKVLIFLMLISSFAELISLGSIIPLLSIFSAEKDLANNYYYKFISNLIGLNETREVLQIFIIMFALFAIISALIRSFNLFFNTRLAASIGSDISYEAFKKTIYQPYDFHIKTNSSEILASFTNHVSGAVSGIFSLFQLATSAIIAFFLITGILLIQLPYSLLPPLVFGIFYFLIANFFKLKLKRNSYQIVSASKELIKIVQESLGSIRDIIIGGNQNLFINQYRKIDYRQRRLKSENWLLSGLPRFAFEAIGLLLISVIALFVIASTNNSKAITLLGAFALGAQKLLPTLNQMFGHWSSVRTQIAEIDIVIKTLERNTYPRINNVLPHKLVDRIKFSNVCFSYKKKSKLIFDDLNFEINKGDKVGIIGRSGSGKSTLIDLLLGLQKPSAGQIFLDNKNLNDNKNFKLLESWRRSIAHIPQNIYLTDSTLLENIAFGIPKDQIDIKKVKLAAKFAEISDFIENTQHGFNTYAGERGVSLSGGQLQRIGIARAIYNNSDLLIIDEGTSALDQNTEFQVLNSIYDLFKDKTLICVTHRLNSLTKCNKIVKIDRGKVSIMNNKEYLNFIKK